MPVTLPPITRRRFLAAAGAIVVAPTWRCAADADPHRVALLVGLAHRREAGGHRPRLQHGRPAEAGRGGGGEARARSRPARSSTATSRTRPAPPRSTSSSRSSSNRSARPASRCTWGSATTTTSPASPRGSRQLRPKDRPVEGKQVVVVELERVEPVRARLLRPEEHGRRDARVASN